MSFADSIPDAEALFEYIIAHCSNPDSPDHGPAHWAHVAETGLRLASSEPECDLTVLFLFSLFHDSMRENEYNDPDHGSRAARLVLEVAGNTDLFTFSDRQRMETLTACTYHSDGDITQSPQWASIRTCWNADRLNLMRVGQYPDPHYLTGKARDPHVIKFESERVFDEPMSWADLHVAYAEFESRDILGS